MFDALSYLLLNSALLISVCALVFFLIGLWLGRLQWGGDRPEEQRLNDQLDIVQADLDDVRQQLLEARQETQTVKATLADCRQALADRIAAATDPEPVPTDPDAVDDRVAHLRRQLDKTGSELEIARAEALQLTDQLNEARHEAARLRADNQRLGTPTSAEETPGSARPAPNGAEPSRTGDNGELPPAWAPFAEAVDAGDARLDDRLGLLFDTPPAAADDLTKIKGIATVLNGKLNEFGIYTYRQIAGWDEAVVAELSKRLTFRDRVQRDDWIGQAKALHSEKYGERLD